MGGVSQLTGAAFVRILHRPFRFRLWFDQMEQVGVNSLVVALLTASFTGMVMVLQTGVQLARFQSENMTPGIASLALLREIAPVLTSLAIAARVGAAITAEIGTMKVTEQLDALESMGTDPIQYLVVPRLVAAMVMLPLLTILTDMVGILGGCLVGVTKLGITFQYYLDITFKWVQIEDFLSGFSEDRRLRRDHRDHRLLHGIHLEGRRRGGRCGNHPVGGGLIYSDSRLGLFPD